MTGPAALPLPALIAAAAVLTLAGCGGSTPVASPAGPASASSSTSAARTSYPVTITDCGGRTTVYDKAPSRVVTLDPSITELLLVLGLQSRIVGYTEFFAPAQQWSRTKAAMSALPRVNDGANYPGKEAVVSAAPDLVISVYSYAFADPLPTRDGWTQLGVRSYQSLGECTSFERPPTDFSLLYEDLRTLGVLFDVQGAAEQEIARLQARVAGIRQKAKDAALPSHVIAFADGTPDHPPGYGGTTNALIALAGSTYAYGDLRPDVIPSWETFVTKDPDVVWVVPDAGTPIETIEKQLAGDSRLAGVTAVKDKAYVVVPQSDATVESPRNVDGLAELVDQLIELKR